MKDRIYLIVNSRGVDRMMKTATNSKLYSGEKRVLVDVEVPDAVFQPPPGLKASLTVLPEHLQSDTSITLDPHADVDMRREGANQQWMNKMAAQVFEKALNSTDRDLSAAALEALQICKEAGVVVKIDVPEPEPPEDQP